MEKRYVTYMLKHHDGWTLVDHMTDAPIDQLLEHFPRSWDPIVRAEIVMAYIDENVILLKSRYDTGQIPRVIAGPAR